ncbi:putative mitochondrial carrier protein [Mytilinidion resinicola]|uniref:Mitochondrial glycine transporter n=1 Tax=Mytilinidion resinicola TaxID=574789 RepID=A0A6A6YXJ5_9PEZI|nr:putative mitochondrial carrier protein [Mytilinidion resinicola]KAF2813219.1 putative mitochondrial carrier protein [Mytilinidion resinicola]
MSDGRKTRSSSSFHFVAGLSSGILSAVLLQPADLLKTRVQQARTTTLLSTIRSIASAPHPVRNFWRGTLPSAIRTGCGSAIYFSTLNALRQRVAFATLVRNNANGTANPQAGGGGHSSSLPKLSNTQNLLTGAAARTWAGFILMPVTVIKVRYESSLYNYTSLFSAIRAIIASEGPRGFFAGFGATAVRDAPYAGLYVLFYEQSKRRLSAFAARLQYQKALKKSETGAVSPEIAAGLLSGRTAASINFASGVAAAGLGTAMTNPFDAIKTRLQLLPQKYGNMVQASKLMLKEEGVRALFNGLGIRMARKAVSSALAWTLYEELIRRAEVRWKDARDAEEVL